MIHIYGDQFNSLDTCHRLTHFSSKNMLENQSYQNTTTADSTHELDQKKLPSKATYKSMGWAKSLRLLLVAQEFRHYDLIQRPATKPHRIQS
jgi:hypothetical protein